MIKLPIGALKGVAVSGIVAAILLIANYEGLALKPYKDVGGVWTVCYGHTGPDVIPTKEYTEDECNNLLIKDTNDRWKIVDKLVTVPLTESEHAAYTVFIYNVGEGAFKSSTLLKKLNAGDRKGACQELLRWKYAAGKVWQGLLTRREMERKVCLGVYSST